jgi:hypothetical protein
MELLCKNLDAPSSGMFSLNGICRVGWTSPQFNTIPIKHFSYRIDHVHDRRIQNAAEIDQQPDHDQEPTQQVWSVTAPKPGDESISRNANAPVGALPSLGRI